MEALGIAAIGLGLAGFVWRDPRTVLIFTAAAALLWVAYFASLGQWGGAAATSLGMMRYAAGAFAPTRWMRWIVLVTIGIGIPLILATSPSLAFGLIVALASTCKASSLLLRDRPILFRLVFGTGEMGYLAFGFLAGAYSTMAWSVLCIGMAVGSAAYFHWRDRRRIATSTTSPTS